MTNDNCPNSTTPATDIRLATIRIAKEYLKFSAAHFTVFSATDRERLHGHNFTVSAEITAQVDSNGMTTNYRLYKDALQHCCEALDEYVLLPGESPYLDITQDNDQYLARFNGRTLVFPMEDTLVLPIRNTTVEEFSYYILQQLLVGKALGDNVDLWALSVSVSSGPGQSGESTWQRQG
ncbi:6-pyruvoyl trahydropterin synthase family protein [Halioxenophilus aromaticivorans]